MVSIFVPFRNSAELCSQCLRALKDTFSILRGEIPAEFIFVDDASDPQCRIPAIIREFRDVIGLPVRAVRLRQHAHYTGACAWGLSLSRGRHVIMISHDMLPTPDFLRRLIAVAESDPTIGIVRGTSQHMDASPHSIAPPSPISDFGQVLLFSAAMASEFPLTAIESPLFIGDSFLVKRSVLDLVGVMDTRFFGFMGDIDFGIRIQRAGFRSVIARGAWLYHPGGGTVYADISAGRSSEADPEAGMPLLHNAVRAFCAKWSMPPPDHNFKVADIHIKEIVQSPAPQGGEFEAPLLGNEADDRLEYY